MNKSWCFPKQPTFIALDIRNFSSDNKVKMKTPTLTAAYFIIVLYFCLHGHFVLSKTERKKPITIHGGWSPWSTVATPCLRKNAKGFYVPVTCGGGMTTRKRSCTNPVPQVICPKAMPWSENIS